MTTGAKSSSNIPPSADLPATGHGPQLPAPWDGHSRPYRVRRNNRMDAQEIAINDVDSQQPIRLSPALDRTQNALALAKLCAKVTTYGFCIYEWTQAPIDLHHSIARLNTLLNLASIDRGVITDNTDLSLLQDLSRPLDPSVNPPSNLANYGFAGPPPGTAGLTASQSADGGSNRSKARFIPYSCRAMNWHTDGYYNTLDDSVRCFNLHCIEPAASGGELVLMDTELLLYALYDDDPELVALLSHPSAMTVPENRDDSGHDRPHRTGPLLFAHKDGALGVHFTTRTKHIDWRTTETRQAVQRATWLIDENRLHHTTVRLTQHQGIITRNILHRRNAFVDSASGPGRQMLRGRYHQLPSHVARPNQSPD